MKKIEKYVSENNYGEAIEECLRHNLNNLGVLLSNITRVSSKQSVKFHTNIDGIKTGVGDLEETPLLSDNECEDCKYITVKLLSNLISSEDIRDIWNRMSKGNYTWNNIRLVTDSNPDYFVVLNDLPLDVSPDPCKTIVFKMENTRNEYDPVKFFKVCENTNHWQLSKTHSELKTEDVKKNSELGGILSTIVCDNYSDLGCIKRVDFVKYLERQKLPIHVFGDDKWGYVDFKGSLPYYKRDDAMFPYKYVFSCENKSGKNYYTEKLIDGILAECLVFYSGCYNMRDFIDEKAFVYLDLLNFDDDCKKVKDAIDKNLWEERLPYIREAKKKILDHISFFPCLESIINKHYKE